MLNPTALGAETEKAHAHIPYCSHGGAPTLQGQLALGGTQRCPHRGEKKGLGRQQSPERLNQWGRLNYPEETLRVSSI